MESGKSNYISGKNELEEFFLECIEEVKKNIKKRKEMQMKNTRFSKSTAKSTVSTSSKEPKLAGFASQDKAKVIELLMENDNVLLFLYEKLFPVTTLSTNQIMMKTEKSNQAEMAKAGSRLSLLTQAGLDRANLSNSTFDLKGE